MVKILTVIPARAGSKGLPGKNLRLLCGRPLISYALQVAMNSRHEMRTIVSTDSHEVADFARSEGAEVPFMRPEELASDSISLIPVAKHAMEYFDASGWRADIVISLQPTAPLVSVNSFDNAIDALLGDTDADSVVSTTLIRHFHPFRSYKIDHDNQVLPLTEYTSEKYLQKQDRPDAYGFTGAFYIRRRALLEEWNGDGFALGSRTLGEVLPEHESVDIESLVDLHVCEVIQKNKTDDRDKS